MLQQMSGTDSIRFRVSSEEKADLRRRAGAKGMSAYIREQVFGAASTGPVGQTPVGEGQDEDSPASPLPAKTWKARVRQLCMQGVPQMAAEKIADQEFRG